MSLALTQSIKTEIRPSNEMVMVAKMVLLSITELESRIEAELQENPLLGIADDEAAERTADLDANEWKKFLDYVSSGPSVASGPDRGGAAADDTPPPVVAATASLAAYLFEQLRLAPMTPAERKLAALIVDCLDDDGYLRIDLEEIAFESRHPLEVVEHVLQQIQELDPPGIAARNLRECLLLQLTHDADGHAARIVRDHLDLVAAKRFDAIAAVLAIPPAAVAAAVRTIVALNPKPGARFAVFENQTVVPDVRIDRVAGEWVVSVRDEGLPRLRIRRDYAKILRQGGDAGTRSYVTDRLNAAKFFLFCIAQRKRMLRAVTNSILRFQREFFEQANGELKPLRLRDVAADINTSEATVSRATMRKFVQTPRGTFPFKVFFPLGVQRASGEPVAVNIVKQQLRALIDAEDGHCPLTDTQITKLLAQKHFRIARRTVTKYREDLLLPPAYRRHA